MLLRFVGNHVEALSQKKTPGKRILQLKLMLGTTRLSLEFQLPLSAPVSIGRKGIENSSSQCLPVSSQASRCLYGTGRAFRVSLGPGTSPAAKGNMQQRSLDDFRLHRHWDWSYAFQPLPYPRGFWRSLRHSLVICVLKHVPVGSHYQLNVGAFGRDPYLCHFRSHPHLKHPWMILGSLLSGCQPSLTLSADVWTNLPLAKTPWVLESDLYPFKMSILSLSVPRL